MSGRVAMSNCNTEGIAVFIFDCSSAHKAFANGALMVHKMNKSPGGMQLKMHNCTIL